LALLSVVIVTLPAINQVVNCYSSGWHSPTTCANSFLSVAPNVVQLMGGGAGWERRESGSVHCGG